MLKKKTKKPRNTGNHQHPSITVSQKQTAVTSVEGSIFGVENTNQCRVAKLHMGIYCPFKCITPQSWAARLHLKGSQFIDSQILEKTLLFFKTNSSRGWLQACSVAESDLMLIFFYLLSAGVVQACDITPGNNTLSKWANTKVGSKLKIPRIN